MNRRENFSAVVNHQRPEWVPVDLGRHVGSIHRLSYIKLRDYLDDPSLQNENKILDRMVQNVIPDEKLLQKFGVDFRWLIPNWVDVEEVSEDTDEGTDQPEPETPQEEAQQETTEDEEGKEEKPT